MSSVCHGARFAALAIIGQVQIESFSELYGVLLGSVLSAALVAYLAEVGIPLSTMVVKRAVDGQNAAGSGIYIPFSAASLTLRIGADLGAQLSR